MADCTYCKKSIGTTDIIYIDIDNNIFCSCDCFNDYSKKKRLDEIKNKKIDKPTIELSDEDFGAVLNCAIRYCIGRETYMPSLVIEFIRPLLPYVSNKALDCFERDIREIDYFGDFEIDKSLWIKFLGEIQSEIKKRNTGD